MTAKVSERLKLGWGVGSLGVAILFNSYAALFLFYLTNVVGMGVALAGTLLFISKIFDIATDIPMGVISDRTDTRWGRRRPYLFVAAIVCGACFIMLFNVPAVPEQYAGTGGAPAATTTYVLAMLLLYALGYTMFNVPYMAMPAEMSEDFHERTSIMSYRVIFIQVGALIAVGAAPKLANAYGGGVEGYGMVGWMLGLSAAAAMLICFFATAKARFRRRSSVTYSIREQLVLAFRNRPFRILAAVKLLQLLGLSSVITSLLFFVKNVLQLDQGVLLIYSVAYAAAALITVPLIWVKASRRFGKRNTYILATAGYVLSVLTWYLAAPGETQLVFAIRSFALGTFASGILLMGITLLPDTMEYDRRTTGMNREGIFAGAYSLVEKFAFAVGPLVVSIVLTLLGYQESVDNANVAQSQQAISAIYLSVAAVPAIAMGLSILLLLRYDLTEAKLDALSRQASAA